MPSIFDWSSTSSSNTTVDGVNIAEGCPAANLNNGIRGVMGIIKSTFSTALQSFLAGSSALPIANGGTAATTASDARTALGLGTLSTASTINNGNWSGTVLSVANGGTGASTAANAFANIAVLASSLGGNGYVKLQNGLIIQWGADTCNANTSTTITYPLAFSSFSRAVISGVGEVSATAQDNFPAVSSCSTASFAVWNASNSCTGFWIAIGV